MGVSTNVIVAQGRGLSEEKCRTIVAGQHPSDLTREEGIAHDMAAALVSGGTRPKLTWRSNVVPRAVVLVVTDPPGPLADATRMLGHDRFLSTGTYLDSLRFRFYLARQLGVSPASVDTQNWASTVHRKCSSCLRNHLQPRPVGQSSHPR